LRYPGQVGVRIGFDEAQARRMFAGSDFLLMPSRFEPCGLSQMYAQRFGSLPIAHQTGGLADTIKDGVTGFLFREPSLSAMLSAIYRAVDTHKSRKQLTTMRRAAMEQTFSWTRSAARYKGLYERMLGAGAAAG
jgi:starch synthase